MKATYQKPSEFKEVADVETFKECPKVKQILNTAGYQLQSDDGECVVFFSFFRPMTEKDLWFLKGSPEYSPDDPLKVLDRMHIGQIKAHVISAAGYYGNEFLQVKDTINWRKYADYYSDKKAKAIFNADTAVRVSLNIVPGEKYGYKGKYDYFDMLVIQKQGRGFIPVYVFTTEEGQKKLPHYWTQIEGIFRYED